MSVSLREKDEEIDRLKKQLEEMRQLQNDNVQNYLDQENILGARLIKAQEINKELKEQLSQALIGKCGKPNLTIGEIMEILVENVKIDKNMAGEPQIVGLFNSAQKIKDIYATPTFSGEKEEIHRFDKVIRKMLDECKLQDKKSATLTMENVGKFENCNIIIKVIPTEQKEVMDDCDNARGEMALGDCQKTECKHEFVFTTSTVKKCCKFCGLVEPAEQIPKPQGLLITCDFCHTKLTEPGALLFGIPNEKEIMYVSKRHLCKFCYSKLTVPGNSEPKKKEIKDDYKLDKDGNPIWGSKLAEQKEYCSCPRSWKPGETIPVDNVNPPTCADCHKEIRMGYSRAIYIKPIPAEKKEWEQKTCMCMDCGAVFKVNEQSKHMKECKKDHWLKPEPKPKDRIEELEGEDEKRSMGMHAIKINELIRHINKES